MQIDRSTCWPAVEHASIVPRVPHVRSRTYVHFVFSVLVIVVVVVLVALMVRVHKGAVKALLTGHASSPQRHFLLDLLGSFVAGALAGTVRTLRGKKDLLYEHCGARKIYCTNTEGQERFTVRTLGARKIYCTNTEGQERFTGLKVKKIYITVGQGRFTVRTLRGKKDLLYEH